MRARRPVPLLVALVSAGALTACSVAADPAPSVTADAGSSGPTGAATTRPVEPSPSTTPSRSTAPASPEESGPPAGDDTAAPPPPGGGDTAPPHDGDPQDGVEVVITFVGPGTRPDVTEVVAYVPDVIEEDGRCTATGAGTTVTVPAWPDVSSTSCGLMELDAALAAGGEVVVTYASSTTSGTSLPYRMGS